MRYEVTLYYRYKDTQVVEADSREEAEIIAMSNAQEEYDCCLDSEVLLLTEENN